MTWIKICGTTNLEDAQVAVEAGADALGFIFYDKSPRKIDPDKAREIIVQLPSHVEAVGVFVGPLSDRVIDIFNHARLAAMQLHFNFQAVVADERKAYGVGCFWQIPKTYLCLTMRDFRLLAESESLDAPAAVGKGNGAKVNSPISFRTIFLDSGTPEKPGGTGKRFDWNEASSLLAQIGKHSNVVVAGGLTHDNVAEAISILKPYGVDVASGVEASPGKKDPEKVRAFIQAVRAAEKNN